MTTNTEYYGALELLPWRSTDRLEREEMEYVEHAIDASAAVRDEAKQTDALFTALREDVPVPMLTHERMRRVMARLDEEPQDARSVWILASRWLKRLRGGSNAFFIRVALPVAMAAGLALVAVVSMMPQQEPGPGDYTTLYDDRPTVPILVTLADGVSATAAQQMFAELAIDATPQSDGTYRVQLPQETSVGELYSVLQTLRADDRIADAQALTEED